MKKPYSAGLLRTLKIINTIVILVLSLSLTLCLHSPLSTIRHHLLRLQKPSNSCSEATMASRSPVTARFFKVMIPGFDTKLRLPLAFSVKLKGKIPEQAFLTSCKGTWRVEIDQCSEGRICFEKGWDNFVENHDLKIGEFVVFEQIGYMHFKATVFDSTACAKEFPVEVHEEEESSGQIIDEHAEKAKRGRGRPRKRAASLQQKEFPAEIHEEETTLGPNVDEHAKEAKRGRGRPRRRAASLQQKESPVEIHEERAPFGRNLCDHTIQKRGRGRPRKRTASFQQKNELSVRKTMPCSTNHDFPVKREFPMEINEEKEPFGKNVHEHAIQMRGRLSNGAASSSPKQSHFAQRIMAYNIDHHSPGLYVPRTICKSYHISEETRISLRGPSRKWHKVTLSQHSKDRLCMKTGWREFCTSNKVEKGDACFFYITHKATRACSETVMMDVKVVKSRS